MSDVVSIDPRTGHVREVVGPETSAAELDTICARAAEAGRVLRQHGRGWRARLLRAMADGLEAQRSTVVDTADAETALGVPRLNGELTRTCFQLRMFADVVEEGGFLEAAIDHAGDTDMGPRPDIRRMLVALGPVAVFGASNFPLAFSVPGGDTASALAAGCPVVAKAHESHPATSRLCGDILATAAGSVGAPDGIVQVVFGRGAGGRLVRHPVVTAVGFTGSVHGGRALLRLIDERPTPIPFYGELGSINPLVVTGAAAVERGTAIGQGLASSFTLGVGQFCTKPGLAFVPSGAAGDEVVSAASSAIVETPAGTMLNADIAGAFDKGVSALSARPGVRLLAAGGVAGSGLQAAPARLLEVDGDALTDAMLEECFGPVTLVVRYADEKSLVASLALLPASLTATVHTGSGGEVGDVQIREALEERAGRVVYNGFPTGVAVSWAQNHGGGWPASNSVHTSVGATSVRRFLRPLAWQDAPESALPVELRDETPGIPRRVDGVLKPQGG